MSDTEKLIEQARKLARVSGVIAHGREARMTLEALADEVERLQKAFKASCGVERKALEDVSFFRNERDKLWLPLLERAERYRLSHGPSWVDGECSYCASFTESIAKCRERYPEKDES